MALTGSRASAALLALLLTTAMGMLGLAMAPPAHACSCVPTPSLDQRIARSDAVVVGSLVSAEPEKFGSGQRKLVLEAKQVYKGEVGHTETLTTGPSSAACGLAGVPTGEDYVFFLHAEGAGGYSTGLCSGNEPLTPTVAEGLEQAAGQPSNPAPATPPQQAPSDDFETRLQDLFGMGAVRWLTLGATALFVLVGLGGLGYLATRTKITGRGKARG